MIDSVYLGYLGEGNNVYGIVCVYSGEGNCAYGIV